MAGRGEERAEGNLRVARAVVIAFPGNRGRAGRPPPSTFAGLVRSPSSASGASAGSNPLRGEENIAQEEREEISSKKESEQQEEDREQESRALLARLRTDPGQEGIYQRQLPQTVAPPLAHNCAGAAKRIIEKENYFHGAL